MSIPIEIVNEQTKLNYLEKELELLKEGMSYLQIIHIYNTFNVKCRPDDVIKQTVKEERCIQQSNTTDASETIEDENDQLEIRMMKEKLLHEQNKQPKMKHAKHHRLRSRDGLKKVVKFDEFCN